MTMNLRGKVSWFGGPQDMGVSPSEGLAFIYEYNMAPHLFLPKQPAGTTGLARRLDPKVHFLACRWDYSQYPKPSLLEHMALVRAPKTGREFLAYPADWGPAGPESDHDTGRVADLSKGLMDALGIQTDDEVEITYPYSDQPEIAAMPYESVCISSGHSTRCQGAVGPSPWGLNEVAEATKVADRVAKELEARGVTVKVFHDTQSTSQSQNLSAITSWHNKQARDLDCSVHFNAYSSTSKPMGTEVLYLTQPDLAAKLSSAIASVGFINRGAKKRTDLAFLNNTHEPAVLLEICFVDSQADVDLYRREFDRICSAIADVLGGKQTGETAPPTQPQPEPDAAHVDIQISGNVMVTINGLTVEL